jgi:hypothetical protein
MKVGDRILGKEGHLKGLLLVIREIGDDMDSVTYDCEVLEDGRLYRKGDEVTLYRFEFEKTEQLS